MSSIEKYVEFESCNIVDAIKNDEDVQACFEYNYNALTN